jgi:hypothetical protein
MTFVAWGEQLGMREFLRRMKIQTERHFEKQSAGSEAPTAISEASILRNGDLRSFNTPDDKVVE